MNVLTCINELSRKALQTSLRLSYSYFAAELNNAVDLCEIGRLTNISQSLVMADLQISC